MRLTKIIAEQELNVELLLTGLRKALPNYQPIHLYSPSPVTADHNQNRLISLAALIELLPQIQAIMTKYCEQNEAVQGAHYSIVTSADLEITQLYNDFIKARFPHDIIISEEEETTYHSAPTGICIFDPIDGTKEFAEKGKHTASVFFRAEINLDGTITDGISLIFSPFTKSLAIAATGIGLITVGDIYVNPDRTPDDVQIPRTAALYSFPKEMEAKPAMADIAKTLLKLNPHLKFKHLQAGSHEQLAVLQRHFDLFIRENHKIWDFLPGAFILSMAGAEVFNFKTGNNLFPLPLDTLLDICKKAPVKSERRFRHVAICFGEKMKQALVQLFT